MAGVHQHVIALQILEAKVVNLHHVELTKHNFSAIMVLAGVPTMKTVYVEIHVRMVGLVPERPNRMILRPVLLSIILQFLHYLRSFFLGLEF